MINLIMMRKVIWTFNLKKIKIIKKKVIKNLMIINKIQEINKNKNIFNNDDYFFLLIKNF
jgi:hypothetical protein